MYGERILSLCSLSGEDTVIAAEALEGSAMKELE